MAVKDIVGTISKITEINPKEFVAKATGKPFTIWSIGIQLDGTEWYNIKNFNKEKAEQVLQCMTLKRPFQIGDRVKLYLESKDNVYWSVTSIVPETAGGKLITEEVVEDAEMIESPKAEGKDIASDAVAKMEAKVSQFKVDDANKFTYGMAANNAVALIVAMIHRTAEPTKEDIYEMVKEHFAPLADQLYEEIKTKRKEKLGY